MNSGNDNFIYSGFKDIMIPKRSKGLATKKQANQSNSDTVPTTAIGTFGSSTSSTTELNEPMEPSDSPQTLPAELSKLEQK